MTRSMGLLDELEAAGGAARLDSLTGKLRITGAPSSMAERLQAGREELLAELVRRDRKARAFGSSSVESATRRNEPISAIRRERILKVYEVALLYRNAHIDVANCEELLGILDCALESNVMPDMSRVLSLTAEIESHRPLKGKELRDECIRQGLGNDQEKAQLARRERSFG